MKYISQCNAKQFNSTTTFSIHTDRIVSLLQKYFYTCEHHNLHEVRIYCMIVVLERSSFSQVSLTNEVYLEKKHYIFLLHHPNSGSHCFDRKYTNMMRQNGEAVIMKWILNLTRLKVFFFGQAATVASLSKLAHSCSSSRLRIVVFPHRLQLSKQLTQQISKMRK